MMSATNQVAIQCHGTAVGACLIPDPIQHVPCSGVETEEEAEAVVVVAAATQQ